MPDVTKYADYRHEPAGYLSLSEKRADTANGHSKTCGGFGSRNKVFHVAYYCIRR